MKNFDTDEKFINIRSENEVKLEKAIGDIENEVKNIAIELNQNSQLCDGIAEAITNVCNWAYMDLNFNDDEKETLEKRWWFCASYNTVSRRITIMVHDHGVGIPATLPVSGASEIVSKWLKTKISDLALVPDDKLIEAVIEAPRTASRKEYRGKGLREMKNLLKKFDKGSLTVISNKGEYKINSKHDKEYGKTNKLAIGGTLVVWEVYSSFRSDE